MMHRPLHFLGFTLTPQFYDSSYLAQLAHGGKERKPPNHDKGP